MCVCAFVYCRYLYAFFKKSICLGMSICHILELQNVNIPRWIWCGLFNRSVSAPNTRKCKGQHAWRGTKSSYIIRNCSAHLTRLLRKPICVFMRIYIWMCVCNYTHMYIYICNYIYIYVHICNYQYIYIVYIMSALDLTIGPPLSDPK